MLEFISWELARCLFNNFNNNNNNNYYYFAVVGRKEELVCCDDRNVETEKNCKGNR
jgi:hypothetical protein